MKVTVRQTLFALDGEDGPTLVVRQARVGASPVVVFAASEKVRPGFLLSILARVVPVREPKLEETSL